MTKQRKIEVLENEISSLDNQLYRANDQVESLSKFPYKLYKILFPLAIDGFKDDMDCSHLRCIEEEVKKLMAGDS